jgi:TRAP-type C4-dicarboxylate transport system substrate-binding protein
MRTGFIGALEIKLASPLPQNSDWGNILDQIATDWLRVTNGNVILNVTHNLQVNESMLMQWLRQDRYQAVVITSEAFYTIAPEVMALSIPFLIRNDAEFDAVLQEVRPSLDAKIEERGYRVMAWAKGGWVKIFSRTPILTPDDLKKSRLAVNPSNAKLIDAFKSMGFQVVGASMNDVTPFLQGNKIDAFYQSPILVQATQIYKYAGNMSSFNLAPFMGGVLINNQGWNSIPEKYRSQLQEIVRRAGIEFEQSFQRRESESIASMRRDGINYVEASPQVEQLWLDTLGPQIDALVERNIFDKGMYQRIQAILQRTRGAR